MPTFKLKFSYVKEVKIYFISKKYFKVRRRTEAVVSCSVGVTASSSRRAVGTRDQYAPARRVFLPLDTRSTD